MKNMDESITNLFTRTRRGFVPEIDRQEYRAAFAPLRPDWTGIYPYQFRGTDDTTATNDP